MPRFHVTAPLLVEFLSSYDSPSFSSDRTLAVHDRRFKVGDAHCSIGVREDKSLVLTLLNVDAPSEAAAAHDAAAVVDMVVRAMSLDLQRDDPNTHYGHVRIAWRTRDLEVRAVDRQPGINISAALNMSLTQNFHAERTNTFVQAMRAKPELAFLVGCHYASLAPADVRSKFYNAFVVIEFLEQNEKPASHPLLSEPEIEKLLLLGDAALKVLSVESSTANRVTNRIKSDLARATLESRADKLFSTLTERFRIQSITYAGTAHSIDRAFVKDLIDARNALFHASSTPRDNLKKQTDLLILVTERVVIALLDEYSAQTSYSGPIVPEQDGSAR